MSSAKDRKQLKALLAQPPRQPCEIILSPNLGAPICRPCSPEGQPPVIRPDHWSDFTESLRPYIVRIVRRIRTGR